MSMLKIIYKNLDNKLISHIVTLVLKVKRKDFRIKQILESSTYSFKIPVESKLSWTLTSLSVYSSMISSFGNPRQVNTKADTIPVRSLPCAQLTKTGWLCGSAMSFNAEVSKICHGSSQVPS